MGFHVTALRAKLDSGTFTLSFDGQTTSNIAWDASADGPWTITFAGTHANKDQPRINGDAARLTNGPSYRSNLATVPAAAAADRKILAIFAISRGEMNVSV